MPRIVVLLVAVLVLSGLSAGSAVAGGSILLFSGNNAIQDEGYSQFSASAGRPITGTSTLPADLSGQSCVMLSLQRQTFDTSQKAALASYLAGGGTILAIAEYSQYPDGGVLTQQVMTNLASSLGASMSFNNDTLDLGPHVTNQIPASQFSSGVGTVGYAATGTINTSGTAFPVVKSEFSKTFVAAQKIGPGTLILAGDSNIWSDNPGTWFATASNGKLVRNLCGDVTPPQITITTPPEGARYRLNQVVLADYACVDPQATNDVASCAGPVPVGSPVPTGAPGPVSFTVNASDQAGNTATKTHNYVVDGSPPQIEITAPADGAVYEPADVPAASYVCTDDDGASDVATCAGDVPVGAKPSRTPGVHTFTVSAADVAGNPATKTVTYSVVDTSAPVITIASPQDGRRYRLNQPLSASFTCVDRDGPSDLAFCTGTFPNGPISTAVPGPFAFTVQTEDLSGNAASKTVNYVVDDSPPLITISTPLDGGEFGVGDVVPAVFGCTDVDGPQDVKTCVGSTPDGNINTSVAGQFTYTVTGSDQAGNTASKTVTYRVVDRSPPTITISTPTEGATYTQGQNVAPNYACSDPDGVADVAQCARSDGAVGSIDTASPGKKTFTIVARDRAGNTAQKSVNYSVTAKTAAAGTSPAVAKPAPASKAACKSRRQFRIRVKKRRKAERTRIVSAVVYVNGKRTQVKKGRRVTAVVTLRGLPKGTYRVVVKAKLSDGRTITDVRRFRTCTPKS